MSKRRAQPTNPSMGPPPDKDVMGPPPVPSLSSSPSVAPTKQKDTQEIAEKYRRLKRKYMDLEEKHRETCSELQRSGERNVKILEERNHFLERIVELQSISGIQLNGSSSASPVPAPASGAFPRSLLSTRARNSFMANLRQAVSEEDAEDEDADPLLTSRHVGPLARQRAEEERKERMEEEAREAKRAARRGRGNQSHTANQKGKEVTSAAPLMTFNQPSGQSNPVPTVVASPIVLSSSTGTRLRIKPPAPPASDPGPSANTVPSIPRQSHGSPVPNARPHPPLQTLSQSMSVRSESPLSPPMSVYDEPSPHSTGGTNNPATAYLRNGSGGGTNSTHSNSPLGDGMGVNSDSAGSPLMSSLSNHPHSLAGSSTNPSPRPTSDVQRLAKPKRLKAHTVTSKSFSIPMVPRDKNNKPMLPLNVGIMTVINLGEVCMREHFHTERYIFPVGYEVTRRYLSTVDPYTEVVYNCSILDGGDGPKFKIVPADLPDRPVIAGTATGAWSSIVKQANHIRNRQHSNSVSGPDFFGLGQNTIKHLIQELPGADRLRDYVWQNFVEGGPLGGRHAAVIPALPEEYDASAPANSHHPSDREKDRGLERRDEKTDDLQYHQLTAIPSSPPQPLQPGVTQIVLPPPTSSETFNIQEYQPPAQKASEKRTGRGSMCGVSPSSSSTRPPLQASQFPSTQPSVEQYPPVHVHHTRSSSRLNRMDSSSSSGAQQLPYPGNLNTTSVSPPPPVPPTFASILNAYSARSASSRPPSSEFVNGTGPE